MSLTVRPAIVPQDYPVIAAVLAAENPGYAETAEELAYNDATRDPGVYHATLVAEALAATDEQAPVIVGVAFVSHDALAHQEGKFVINLRVRPDWQGRGVGKALYAALLAHVTPLAPRELTTTVWHQHPRTPRFLTERGFVEAWRRVDLFLDVTTFDLAPHAGLAARLQEQGIAIKSYAELADGPDRLAKLHELDWALWQSIPYGQPVAKRSLAQFAAQEVDHPKFIADACFIAVKESAFIGYSNLSATDQGFNTEMTGVLPAYRGQGVATLLKLYGIRYTQAHDKIRLETQNDAVNQAMMALNQKLGFVVEGANLRFVKQNFS